MGGHQTEPVRTGQPVSDDIRETAKHTLKVLGLPSEIADEHTWESYGCEYVFPFQYGDCAGCKLERDMRVSKEVMERLKR